MKLAIMQPYFFPYIGYFQLISAVDEIIIYDNIEYTKKGWINRNRILLNGSDYVFTIPIKKASDYLDISSRELAADFRRSKLLNILKEAYRKAPYYNQTFPLLEEIIQFEDPNLFRYIFNSIQKICTYLNIQTKLKISSECAFDISLKGQDKVIAICKSQGCLQYINTIGGKELYEHEAFNKNNLQLRFIQSKPFNYQQFNISFIPFLSIIDVLMFNSIENLSEQIKNGYDLIE